jgi:NitT/TauT family transport system permease protein
MSLHLKWISLATVVALIGLWFIASAIGLTHPDTLPGPGTMFAAFIELIKDGYAGTSLLGHIGASVGRAFVGFAAAIALGVPIGLFVGRHPVADAICAPIIGFFRPIPPIAFITLFIFYFGIGEGPKIGLIFMACFWYVILNCSDGVRAIPESLFKAGRNIGLNRRQLFFHVTLPASMPSIMTSVRAASAISWTLVVASELIGAQSGLGFMILDSAQYFNIPLTYIGIIIIGIIGLIWEMVIVAVQRRVLHWQGL